MFVWPPPRSPIDSPVMPAALTFDKLTREAVHETKRRFLDSFATAVGAMPSDAYAMARVLARISSNLGASILGGGQSSVRVGPPS